MSLQKLEEQDRKALNVKEQLQREHRYLKRRLEQLSVSGTVERIRTDSMGSTISTDSEQGALFIKSVPYSERLHLKIGVSIISAEQCVSQRTSHKFIMYSSTASCGRSRALCAL